MARPSNTHERREQIVRALAQVMARDGYERASVATIAAHAGLSQGLVHYHFTSKQEILLSLIDRLADDAIARAREAARTHDAPRARLLAMVDAFLALGPQRDQGAVACWIAVAAEAASQADVRARWVSALGRIAAEIETEARGALPDELPRGARARRASRIGAVTVAGVLGWFSLYAAAKELVPRGSAAPSVRASVLAILDAPPPTTGARPPIPPGSSAGHAALRPPQKGHAS